MVGRPLKKGLQYSPWTVDVLSGDTDIDRLMEAKGCDGFVIYFYLCQMAYKFEGYYLKWSYSDAPTTAKRIGGGVGSKTVEDTVNLCLRLGLFDKCLFDRHGILTSRRIQETYVTAVKKSKRLGNAIIADYRLLEKNSDSGGLAQSAPTDDFHGRNPNFFGRNAELSGRNARESKGNKNKETDVPQPPASSEETRISSEEIQRSEALDYYLNRLNPTPSEICTQQILEFERDMGSDMVIRACQIALDKRIDGNPWNYIKAILTDKKRAGIRTMAQWDEAERQRTRRHSRGQSAHHANAAGEYEYNPGDTSDSL